MCKEEEAGFSRLTTTCGYREPGTGRSRFRPVSNTTWFGCSCGLKAQEQAFLALKAPERRYPTLPWFRDENGTGRDGTGRDENHPSRRQK